MTANRDRLMNLALQATAIFALVMLFHGAVWGENGGCTNKSCKNITVWQDCTTITGWVYQLMDCATCKNIGRCDTGYLNQQPCNSTKQPQKIKSIEVTATCDCTKAPKNGVVEASGSYTNDNWSNSAFNQDICESQGVS